MGFGGVMVDSMNSYEKLSARNKRCEERSSRDS